ncbi:MAG: hypothetical protein F6K24_54570, partial [Okeania sp. SIO2D1]|nr:hypothetical protein [Okeania sp. SIO2D1]
MAEKSRINRANNNKIDVRAAVSAAKKYLQSLQSILEYKIQDLRLEEVEFSDSCQLSATRLSSLRTVFKLTTDFK